MRSRSALASRRALGGLTFALVVGCNGAETPVPRPAEPLPEPDAAAPCVPVEGSVPIDLVGGSDTLLALFDDGTVWCFGNNRSGQCSDDLYDQQPLRLARLGCATQVAMGLTTGLAILRDGRVQSWGTERFETLGDGPGSATRPGEVGFVLLDEPARFVDSSAQSAGAVTAAGEAYWWGELLDQPSSSTLSNAPLRVELRSVVELHAEVSGSCARDERGRVFCFGPNGFGQLGQPGLERSTVPLEVPLPEPAIQLAHLGLTVCALLESGRVDCWGANFGGALGRGVEFASVESAHQPAPVLVDEPLLGIAGGSDGACGWTAEGRVHCWGANNIYRFWPAAEWPDKGSDFTDGIPRRIVEVEPALRVALMKNEMCALGFDHRVRCRQSAGDPGRGQYAFEVKFEEEPREEDEDDPG